MLNALDNLPEDPVELRRVTELLASEVKAQALMIEKLQHQLHGANRHRFGSKSEGMDQLQLLAENEEIAEAAVKAAETAPAEPIELKEKPRRKPLPDHLERIEQVLSVGEDCPECGGDLSKLGEDITEELEYIPGRFVVNKITRPRMACRRCEAISQAPMPSRPIERGRPGPGLLAHVLVSKFADHLPLYRQSQIYAREGVDLDRSTMADWVGKSTGLLEPLAEAIAKRAKGGTSLFADDTPLKMLAPGNKKTKTARIWAYVRDERPWSGPCATGAQTDNLSSCAGRAPPCVWYQFTVDRKGEHPVKHLSGYQGWVHADGYAGFNGVFGEGKATEVACMAHIGVVARIGCQVLTQAFATTTDMLIMPHKFNTSRRHKFAKKKYRVTNWCGYNESLRNRGDLTVWITGDARKHWAAPRRRSRGGQPRYSDLAITMCLTLGMVYRLPLRQTQGLIRSISKLMLLEISVPDFSTLSRRGRGLSLPARPKIKITDPVHLAIDSTGLKVFDEGEWLQSKYNVKAKRKRWRKLHLGLNLVTGDIVCSDLTLDDVGDPTVLPDLLNQIGTSGLPVYSGRCLRRRTDQ